MNSYIDDLEIEIKALEKFYKTKVRKLKLKLILERI
jgi:hypothetical protein